jgi:hypothetical protein
MSSVPSPRKDCDLGVNDVAAHVYEQVKIGQKRGKPGAEFKIIPEPEPNEDNITVANSLLPFRVSGARIVRLNDEMFAMSGDFQFTLPDTDVYKPLYEKVVMNFHIRQRNLSDYVVDNGFYIKPFNSSMSIFNTLFQDVFDVSKIRRVCHMFEKSDGSEYLSERGLVTKAEKKLVKLYAGPDIGNDAGGTTIGRWTVEDERYYKPVSLLSEVEGDIKDVVLYKTGAEDDYFLYCAVKTMFEGNEIWHAVDIESACSHAHMNEKLYKFLCSIENGTAIASVPGYMYTKTINEDGIATIDINLKSAMKKKIGREGTPVIGVWSGNDPNFTDIINASNYRHFMNFGRARPPVAEAGERPWKAIMGGPNWFDAAPMRGGHVARLAPNTEPHWMHFD